MKKKSLVVLVKSGGFQQDKLLENTIYSTVCCVAHKYISQTKWLAEKASLLLQTLLTSDTRKLHKFSSICSTTLLFLLRTSKILPRLDVLFFFQQFEPQNVLILFLTAIYSFVVENRLQRPSGVYVCPVFSSRTCVHARHVIVMVLYVLYQVTVQSCNFNFF